MNGPFSAGFLSTSQAIELNQLAMQVRQLGLNAANNGLNNNLNTVIGMHPPLKFFRAKLTGYDEDTQYFDWVEQSYETASGGAPYDKPAGLTGTFELQPAKLMPGLPVPSDVSPYNPVQCVMVQKGVTSFGSIEYEIVFIAPSTTLEVVTCVSVTKESGVITDVIVEKQLVSIFGELIYDPVCELNPIDCCEETVEISCCEEPVPKNLKACFVGSGDCSCYSFEIPLSYLGELTPGAFSWGTLNAIGEYGYAEIEAQVTGIEPCTTSTSSWNLLLQCLTVEESQVWVLSGRAGNGCIFDPITADPVLPLEGSCDPFYLGPLSLQLVDSELCCQDEVFVSIIPLSQDCDEPAPPPPGDCCPFTEDVFLTVLGTDDFAGLSSVYSFVYDPTAIDTIFTAAGDYDSRFQWYATMADGVDTPYAFFGCLDGVYYWGFAGNGLTNPRGRGDGMVLRDAGIYDMLIDTV